MFNMHMHIHYTTKYDRSCKTCVTIWFAIRILITRSHRVWESQNSVFGYNAYKCVFMNTQLYRFVVWLLYSLFCSNLRDDVIIVDSSDLLTHILQGFFSGTGVRGVIPRYDDVIKWKHFPRNWPFVRGIHRSPVNSPHKGQWRGALVFSLICAWINAWVNNREAGDLRRSRAHYDVSVMRHG